LDIGTLIGGSDVVKNGIATAEWDLNNQTHVSGPWTEEDVFFLQLFDPFPSYQEIVSINTTSSNSSVCVLELSGDLLSTMKISTDAPSQLIAKYICNAQGSTQISVVLWLGANYSSTLFR